MSAASRSPRIARSGASGVPNLAPSAIVSLGMNGLVRNLGAQSPSSPRASNGSTSRERPHRFPPTWSA